MTSELFDITGKVALVTGATQGLGYAIAEGLGKAGARLVINARNPEKLEKAIASLKQQRIEVYGYLFDVTDSIEIEKNIEKIEKEVGPIEILVNNAGIIKRGPLENFPDEDWDEILKINLSGVF